MYIKYLLATLPQMVHNFCGARHFLCLPEITPIIMIHGPTKGTNEYIFHCVRTSGKRISQLVHCFIFIDITFVSECLCHLRAQYLIQSPNTCSRKQILLSVHPVSVTGWPCFCTLLHSGSGAFRFGPGSVFSLSNFFWPNFFSQWRTLL